MENEQLMDDHRFKMPNSIPPSVTSAKKRKSSEEPKSQNDASYGLATDDFSKRMRSTPTDVVSGVKSKFIFLVKLEFNICCQNIKILLAVQI